MLQRLPHICLSDLRVGDIDVQVYIIPPVKLPTGFAWKSIEEFWSDLVNELPEIPYGGNRYFFNKLQPMLCEGTICCLCKQECPAFLFAHAAHAHVFALSHAM